MTLSHEEQYQRSWQERQEYAENMQPIIGRLYRNKGIELVVYGKPLVNATTIDIIKAHKTVERFEQQKLRLRESFPVLEAISKLDLAPGRIDLGKLAFAYAYKNAAEGLSLEQYLQRELADLLGQDDKIKPTDVVLYGFGRIGRLLARLMIERAGPSAKLRLRAIVVRGGRKGDLDKRASLLRRDSIHGPFNGSITVDEENGGIKANGTFIKVIYADSPEQVDYTAYDIHDALVVDNTGIWKDDKELSIHFKAKGAAKVLLTAPAKARGVGDCTAGQVAVMGFAQGQQVGQGLQGLFGLHRQHALQVFGVALAIDQDEHAAHARRQAVRAGLDLGHALDGLAKDDGHARRVDLVKAGSDDRLWRRAGRLNIGQLTLYRSRWSPKLTPVHPLIVPMNTGDRDDRGFDPDPGDR